MFEIIGGLLVLFVILSVLVHNEWTGLAVFFGVVALFAGVGLNKDAILPFLQTNWPYILYAFIGYFLLGALYSIYAFYAFVNTDVKEYKKEYDERDKRYHPPEDFKKNYNYHLWNCSDISLRATSWIGLWPLHIVGDTLVFVCKDMIVEISRFVYTKMVGIYKDIADKIIDRISQ